MHVNVFQVIFYLTLLSIGTFLSSNLKMAFSKEIILSMYALMYGLDLHEHFQITCSGTHNKHMYSIACRRVFDLNGGNESS